MILQRFKKVHVPLERASIEFRMNFFVNNDCFINAYLDLRDGPFLSYVNPFFFLKEPQRVTLI